MHRRSQITQRPSRLLAPVVRALRSDPAIEPLERRRLLTTSFAGGVVNVAGLAGNDVVNVSIVGTGSSARLRVVDDGVTNEFLLSTVIRVAAQLGNGNDRFTAGDLVTVPVSVAGGAGSDTVTGSSRNDSIDGGAGADS